MQPSRGVKVDVRFAWGRGSLLVGKLKQKTEESKTHLLGVHAEGGGVLSDGVVEVLGSVPGTTLASGTTGAGRGTATAAAAGWAGREAISWTAEAVLATCCSVF